MVQDCSMGTAMNIDRLRGVAGSTVKRVRRVEVLAGMDELPKGDQVQVRIL
jgi:hypothetical protein